MKILRNFVLVVLALKSISCTQIEKSVGQKNGHTYISNYKDLNTDDILTLDLDAKTKMPAKGTERNFASEKPQVSKETTETVNHSTYWVSVILSSLGLPIQPVAMGEKMKWQETNIQLFSPKKPLESRPKSSFVYSQVVGYDKERNLNGGEWVADGSNRLALGFKAKSLTSSDFKPCVLDVENTSAKVSGLALTYNHSKELTKRGESSLFSISIGSNNSAYSSSSSSKAVTALSVGSKFTPYELSSSGCQEFEFAKDDVLVLYENGTYKNKRTLWLLQLVSVTEAKSPQKGYVLSFNIEKIDISE